MSPALSILFVAYDMQREMPRTLASALPPLQRKVERSEYEVVVLDNGSPEPLRLDPGLADTVVRIPPGTAAPSPVAAINATVRDRCNGRNLLICIDGARMFSALLLRRTLDLLARWPDAATFVQSRHIGHEKQMAAVRKGWSQTDEDALMATVPWQDDLDALWDISVLAGAHGAKNPLYQTESNAMGMSRATWDALGGFNEGFVKPGGGLCNLELFNRLLARTDGPAIALEGEATFHQFHGGAATANPGYFQASLDEYRAATGTDYAKPPMRFLVAPGVACKRTPRT